MSGYTFSVACGAISTAPLRRSSNRDELVIATINNQRWHVHSPKIVELGLVMREQGNFARANQLFEESLAFHRVVGDRTAETIRVERHHALLRAEAKGRRN